MNKFLKYCILAPAILSVESCTVQNTQKLKRVESHQRFELRNLRNGTVGRLTSGYTFTPNENSDPELGYKKGVPMPAENDHDGIGIYLNLQEETQSYKCTGQIMVNTANHTMAPEMVQTPKEEIVPGPFSMNNGVKSNPFIGILPSGSDHKNRLGDTVDNISKISLITYTNSGDDSGFYYTEDLPQTCLDMFITTRPPIINGTVVKLSTLKNYEFVDRREGYETITNFIDGSTLKETRDQYSLNSFSVEGIAIDKDARTVKKMTNNTITDLSNGEYLPDSAIPVIYKVLKSSGKIFTPTSQGTSGSPITADGNFVGSHIASNGDSSKKTLISLKNQCNQNAFGQSSLCKSITRINPETYHLGYFSPIAQALKNQKLRLKE